uniref:Integrase, catalytic region, zinc finger, CCHC-type, peptidase aspartic, catalytic n=1 Tax=Tanacetum cinerariifolium TaxID=118510 RepID=A0A6L2N4L7_TANCI|nr:integrase, catalytic region, zinc finger, CCHC-type, peptidase aspartic, catalytic [Tanacetum cinerariifolium]
MSRDVITVGSTMRIPLLYRGEYSQWRERFMNYLEEQTDGEAMTNFIQNSDQPLPVIAQVSLAETAQNAPSTLKDPKIWTAEEKKTRKIDRLEKSLLIQRLPNDIYSLIDSNETSNIYGMLLKGRSTEGEQLLDTYLRYLQMINDLKKCGYKKDNCELNCKFLNNLQPEWKKYGTLMRQTKNLMDINIDALYNILKQNQGDVNDALGYKKKAVVVTSDPLALVAEKTKVRKCKEKVEVQSESEESDDEDISDLKKIIALLAKAFNRKKYYVKPINNNLRTSSASFSANKKQEFVKSVEKKEDKKVDEKKRDMSKVKCYNCKKEGHFAKDYKKAKVKDYNYYKTKMLLAKKDSDEQVLLAEDQAWMESSSDSDQKINANMVSWLKLKRKKINEQEILFDNMSRQLVEMNNNALRLQEKILEKKTKILELEGCVSNKDVEIEKCLERLNKYEKKLHKIRKTNQTIHMIMPSKDTLYNGRKGIGFENPSYFEKANDLGPSLYDQKVIGLGYTLMFLIYSDEALEIKKFKRARENKIEFAYDYGNLNASYQTSSLKPYVPTVILEKIIFDLEDEVVSLLKKEKANLETIKSLKSKCFKSSENAISESENQSENDCQVVEKECDQVENSKVLAPGMFKLSVSQSVSPIFVTKTSCDSKNVENRTKRKRHLDTFSSVRRPKHSGIIDLSSIVQIYLWIIDSGCSRHMTGNGALLTNFVEKFLGTVRFGNNDFRVIAGYEDVVIGSMTIKKFYYVEGLGHNLSSVG